MAGRVMVRVYEAVDASVRFSPLRCPARDAAVGVPYCAHQARGELAAYCPFLYGYELVDKGSRIRRSVDSSYVAGLDVRLMPGEYIEALCLRCESKGTPPGS